MHKCKREQLWWLHSQGAVLRTTNPSPQGTMCALVCTESCCYDPALLLNPSVSQIAANEQQQAEKQAPQRSTTAETVGWLCTPRPHRYSRGTQHAGHLNGACEVHHSCHAMCTAMLGMGGCPPAAATAAAASRVLPPAYSGCMLCGFCHCSRHCWRLPGKWAKVACTNQRTFPLHGGVHTTATAAGSWHCVPQLQPFNLHSCSRLAGSYHCTMYGGAPGSPCPAPMYACAHGEHWKMQAAADVDVIAG
jgi:hypothetical protein